LGERWTWTDRLTGSDPVTRRYNVLISDIDMVADNSQAFGSHPDDAGVMQSETYQNEVPTEHQTFGVGVNKFVMSRWYRPGTHARGLVELNFGAEDGSVERFDQVAWEPLSIGDHREGRLSAVPWTPGADWWPAVRVTVPVAN
jgi:hypothetical protein